MKISLRLAGVLTATSLMLNAALPPAAYAAMVAKSAPPPMLAHGEHLCGGVGQDEVMAMREQRHHYNLRLTFAQARTGDYLADVTVAVDAANRKQTEPKVLLEDCGPLMYLRLAPGDYKVAATHHGQTQNRRFHVGRTGADHVIYWPAP